MGHTNLQNTQHKTKNRAAQTPMKTGDEVGCSGVD
jgi:hypothetical protein